MADYGAANVSLMGLRSHAVHATNGELLVRRSALGNALGVRFALRAGDSPATRKG